MSSWHGKDPDAQTTWRFQDQIPGAELFAWQQGLRGAGFQRKQSVPAQAQPESTTQERHVAQLGKRKCKHEPGRAGEKSICITRYDVIPAHQSPPKPPSNWEFVSDHSPLGRTNIETAAMLFLNYTHNIFGMGNRTAPALGSADNPRTPHAELQHSSPSLAGICTPLVRLPAHLLQLSLGGPDSSHPTAASERGLGMNPQSILGIQVPKGISSYLTPCLQER